MSQILKIGSKDLEKRKVGRYERLRVIAERKRRKKKKAKGKQVKHEAVSRASSGDFPFETIHGFELKEVEYKVPSMQERKSKRKAFKEFKSQVWIKAAKESPDKLLAIGISQKQIDEQCAQGRGVNGYNVHHMLPIHGGGKNELSNMVIMPIPPHDDLHHVVIDRQIQGIKEGETRKIKLPVTDSMVFVPTNELANFDKNKDYEGKGKGNKNYKTNSLNFNYYKDNDNVESFKKALQATKSKYR